MNASGDPEASRPHGDEMIQIERRNRSAANGCRANDLCAAIAPLKVFRPHVATWIEEPDLFTSAGIAGSDLPAFEMIAKWATQT